MFQKHSHRYFQKKNTSTKILRNVVPFETIYFFKRKTCFSSIELVKHTFISFNKYCWTVSINRELLASPMIPWFQPSSCLVQNRCYIFNTPPPILSFFCYSLFHCKLQEIPNCVTFLNKPKVIMAPWDSVCGLGWAIFCQLLRALFMRQFRH